MRRGFKLSVREQRMANARQFEFMAGAAPAEKREAAQAFADSARAAVPPKRKYTKAPRMVAHNREVLEGDVIRAVADLLAAHPLVLFAVRQNSGALPYMTAAGKPVPVWFYKWVKRPDKMRLSDFWFATKDTPARIGAIECKRENWRGPTDDREREQAKFLEIVRATGGVSGFARSADEAQAIIEGRAPALPPF